MPVYLATVWRMFDDGHGPTWDRLVVRAHAETPEAFVANVRREGRLEAYDEVTFGPIGEAKDQTR